MRKAKLILKASLFGLAFLTINIALGQSNSSKSQFPEFASYKTWGFTFNPVLNRAPNYTRTLGNIDIKGNSIPGVNFGFNKVIQPERELSFRYGVHLNLLPLESIQFRLPDGDIPGFTNFESNERTLGQLIISVPLEMELKKQMGSRIYFSARIGVNLTLLREGSVEGTVSAFVEDLNEGREIFGIRGQTRKFPIYPNLKISPGFYFMTKPILYQVSIIYQKAIPNYFTGEYLFDNLEISERTEGTYSLSGDQLGIGITLFLRKSQKKLKKLEEKAVKNVYIN